jgi:predicted phage tail protein
MTKRIQVFLHGSLRKIHPEPIEISAGTAWQAIEMVTTQLPGFQPTAQGYKSIRVAGHPTVERLHDPLTDDELHIYPQISGGKNGGFVQVLVGVALIGITLITAGGAAGVATAIAGSMQAGATFGMVMTATAFMMGVSTVIGGIVTLLMPQPSMGNNATAQEASKYLGVPQSTTAIGTTIRVIYGMRRVGFHYLSFVQNAKPRRA